MNGRGLPDSVLVREVGPRDGFQNEPETVVRVPSGPFAGSPTMVRSARSLRVFSAQRSGS